MFSEPLACDTVDLDGSDFVVTVESGLGAEGGQLAIDDAGFDAVCDGATGTLTAGNFQDRQTIRIDRAAGSVLTDVAGNEQPVGDTVSFMVATPRRSSTRS